MKDNARPCTSSVDLSNLRSITEGDKELERELFDDFITGATTAIAALDSHCCSDDSTAWKEHSHFLKGISRNLGAHGLANLCLASEETALSPTDRKIDILQKINTEFEHVKKVLIDECRE